MAFSLIRRFRETETFFVVSPESRPVTMKPLPLATLTLSGPLAGIRLAASLSATSVFAPNASGDVPPGEPPAGVHARLRGSSTAPISDPSPALAIEVKSKGREQPR